MIKKFDAMVSDGVIHITLKKKKKVLFLKT